MNRSPRVRHRREALLSLVAVSMAVLVTAPVQAQSDGWDWDLGIYLWASDVTVDTEEGTTEVSFSDLVDKLEAAFSVHFEGRKAKAGFLADVMLISLADSVTTIDHPQLPDGSVVDLDVDVTLLELGGFWRPSGGEEGFDLLGGVRLIELDDRLTITPPGGPALPQESMDTSLVDPYIGARYSLPLSPRWGFLIRGDIGAGDTDLIWNTNAYLRFTVGSKGNKHLVFGYRHLELDLDDDQIESQMSMSGPLAAFAFGF